MNDKIDYQIIGSDIQAVSIGLDPSEVVRAEPGSLMYMEDDIQMQTNAEGGLFKGLKRMFSGESFFITNFLNSGSQKRTIAFSAPYPGHIMPVDLKNFNGVFYCQKNSFLCAAGGVDVDMSFTKKLGAGFFGGEGFILQKLAGDGLAFVHIGGTLVEKELAPGETLRVDTGCLAGFTEGITYDIQFIGGFQNTLFGGEGLFFATLTGPGKVFLQTLPFSRIADRINSGRTSGEVRRGGGLIGTLTSGN